MFSAAIANHGTLMYPYLVQQVVGPGVVSDLRASPSTLSQAVSPTVASYMQSMMYQVTNNPGRTAYATAGPQATGGITIDGKTGTAQNGIGNGNLNDAVFTCCARRRRRTVADRGRRHCAGGRIRRRRSRPIAVQGDQGLPGGAFMINRIGGGRDGSTSSAPGKATSREHGCGPGLTCWSQPPISRTVT